MFCLSVCVLCVGGGGSKGEREGERLFLKGSRLSEEKSMIIIQNKHSPLYNYD